MEILVVNDDGVTSEGIRILAEHLKPYGNVTVAAPDQGRSAASHSLLIYQKITFEQVDVMKNTPCYAVSGMPADCVRLATSILGKKFDIVFSGINNGLNVGTDIIYSGTVAAAREAVIEGIPGVALSVDHDCFAIAHAEIDDVLKYIMENKLYSHNYVLNVNFPVKSHFRSKGYKFTRQGIKSFKTEFLRNNEGSYDVLSDTITYDSDPECDVSLGKAGYVTFTPCCLDQTDHTALRELKKHEH